MLTSLTFFNFGKDKVFSPSGGVVFHGGESIFISSSLSSFVKAFSFTRTLHNWRAVRSWKSSLSAPVSLGFPIEPARRRD